MSVRRTSQAVLTQAVLVSACFSGAIAWGQSTPSIGREVAIPRQLQDGEEYELPDSTRAAALELRQQYSARIRSTYNLHFGVQSPFQPSNALIEGEDFIQPGAFPTAAYCGHCHAAAYEQWQQSLHRNAFREPFYTKNVTLLDDTKGIEYSRHCEGCHNPIALFSGALTQNAHVDRGRADDEGVSCSVCHSIAKLQPMSGNGAYVMGIPAAITDAQGNPIPGEVPFTEIMAHPDRHRSAVMKDFYKSPEFCGSCHRSSIPRILNDYKWVSGFGTYDEWQASAVSNRNPIPYYQRTYLACQTCHMAPEDAGNNEYGAKNGAIASHRWLGGNSAVPFYYGFAQQTAKTIAFLQNRNLSVDLFALYKPDLKELIAPLLSTPVDLKPKERIQVLLVIQNKGLGHSLIPEQRDFYEAWVEFLATDSTGREIFHSGCLKSDGTLEERAHSFTNRLLGADGRNLARHEIWLRRAVAYDNTIQAGRSALVRYEFQVPEDVNGPLVITARVNYRHFNQEYLNYVLGADHARYPIVEMATASRTIKIERDTIGQAVLPEAMTGHRNEQNASAKVTQDFEGPEWMRWNNFGIALMDQGQWAGALSAFERVVSFRPDYADGYTNIALANLSWEKYDDASTSVQKALALLCPPERGGATAACFYSLPTASTSSRQSQTAIARAFYYRALINRNLGALNESVNDLEQVVKQFPQSRDAERELAVSYYLTHQDAAALRQFEALQANSPDDVLCHFYLAILYRRAGMTAKATEQAKLYNQKRDDQQAASTAEHFLQMNDQAHNENLPAHVHSDVNQRTLGTQHEVKQR